MGTYSFAYFSVSKGFEISVSCNIALESLQRPRSQDLEIRYRRGAYDVHSRRACILVHVPFLQRAESSCDRSGCSGQLFDCDTSCSTYDAFSLVTAM